MTDPTTPAVVRSAMQIPSYQFRGDSREDHSLTPMIDVVFLLLIFFVCASIGQKREDHFGSELGGDSVDAEAFEKQEKPLGEVWVRLQRDRENTIAVLEHRTPGGKAPLGDYVIAGAADGRPGRSQLEHRLTALAAGAAEIPVLLEVDGDVTIQAELNLRAVCTRAGFQSILDVVNESPDAEPKQ